MESIGTVLVAAALVCVIGLITWKLLRGRKRGKTSCGCDCGHCALSGACHANKE